jgi:hypothetical protein
VRPQRVVRSLVAAAAIIVSAACGSSSPAAPTGTAPPATANQVLRIAFQGLCMPVNGNVLSMLPLTYSRVLVRQDGSDWVATGSSPAAGDVELRFRQNFGPPGAGFIVTATIKGTARHMPETVPTLPAWESEIIFGAEGTTTLTLSSVGIGGGAFTAATALDGRGSGPVTLTNSTGERCTGSAFTLTLSPQL